MDLRERLRAEIASGGSRRAAARRCPRRQQASAVSDGSARFGRGRAGHHDAVTGGQATGGEVHYGASGLTAASASEGRPVLYKKVVLALEARREDVRQARDERKVDRQPRMRSPNSTLFSTLR